MILESHHWQRETWILSEPEWQWDDSNGSFGSFRKWVWSAGIYNVLRLIQFTTTHQTPPFPLTCTALCELAPHVHPFSVHPVNSRLTYHQFNIINNLESQSFWKIAYR
jgi:hypothetical protein